MKTCIVLGGGEHPTVEILLQIALQKHFSKLKQEGCIGDGAVGSGKWVCTRVVVCDLCAVKNR